MGFALFEGSGTFNPAAYGLSVGDTLNIICVGGGGSGGTAQSNKAAANGTTGGTSSFGSYISALGGSGGLGTPPSTISKQGFPTQGQYLGGCGMNVSSGNYGSVAGGGAGGWHPSFPGLGGHGIDARAHYETLGDFANRETFAGAPSKIYIRKADGEYEEVVAPATKYTGCYPASNLSGEQMRSMFNGAYSGRSAQSQWCGCGGAGYGAGGGGAVSQYNYASCGGNSGEVKYHSLILTSTSAIAVTVGTGGVAPNGDGNSCVGGRGADGCVCVFW